MHDEKYKQGTNLWDEKSDIRAYFHVLAIDQLDSTRLVVISNASAQIVPKNVGIKFIALFGLLRRCRDSGPNNKMLPRKSQRILPESIMIFISIMKIAGFMTFSTALG